MFKSERREQQRRNRRKMIVRGRSVFSLAAAQAKRDERLLSHAPRGRKSGPKVVQ